MDSPTNDERSTEATMTEESKLPRALDGEDSEVSATVGMQNAEKETSETREAKVEVLSHGEIIHIVKDTVAGLISTDPLLKDLHPYVTLEEVNSMIALEYGQAMVVNVQRADDDIMPIVVKQEATVLDLKHGIKRYITLQLSRKGEGNVAISWHYVWKHHWLYFEGEKLMDDSKLLKEDKVTFIKRLQER